MAAFQAELEDATLRLNDDRDFGLHDDGVAVDLALYLLDEVGVNEFLKGKHTVTASYTATATDKAGVEFSLAGELSFQMAAPSADDVAQAKAAFLGALADKAEDIDVAEVAIEEEDISVTFHWGADVQEVYAVSYTHLDVYKRQAVNTIIPKSLHNDSLLYYKIHKLSKMKINSKAPNFMVLIVSMKRVL